MLLFAPWAASSKPEKQSINVLNWSSDCKRKHCLKQQGEDKSLFPSPWHRRLHVCTDSLVRLPLADALSLPKHGGCEGREGRATHGSSRYPLGQAESLLQLGITTPGHPSLGRVWVTAAGPHPGHPGGSDDGWHITAPQHPAGRLLPRGERAGGAAVARQCHG